MKKYISAVATLMLVLTMLLAGLPGTAHAAGSVDFSVKPQTTELIKGGDVVFEYTITNTGASAISDCAVLYNGSSVKTGISIAPGDSASGQFTLTVSDSMLGQTLNFALSASDGTTASATATVNKKTASVKLKVTAKADKEKADSGDTVTFTFKCENQGEADITDIVIKAKGINSGKALKDSFSLAAGSDAYSFTYKQTMTDNLEVTPTISYKANGASQDTITLDPITVTLSERKVDVVLTADNKTPDAGEDVTFTLNVTNNGNVSYSKMKVSMNGEEVEFPSTSLKPSKSYEQTYTKSFQTSTEVSCTVTMLDENGEQKNVSSNVIDIELPVDSSVVNDKLKLTMSVDRPQLTSAGTINFSGSITNATDYDLLDVEVNEATLGSVFSAESLEAGGQATITGKADINATTEYQFVLTATDKDGNNYTINADPITVTIQSVEPTPTNFDDAAEVTESGQVLDTGGKSFDWGQFFLILAIVLIVLIVGVGVALIILWKKGKGPGSRPSSGRPTSGRPAPRPSPSPGPSSPVRKKPTSSNSYGRSGSGPRKPTTGTKTYRDRNNF